MIEKPPPKGKMIRWKAREKEDAALLLFLVNLQSGKQESRRAEGKQVIYIGSRTHRYHAIPLRGIP